MNIVREFVTRLSFSIDRTNLNRFEGLLNGLRGRFNIFRAEITNIIDRVASFIRNISTVSLQAKSIAEYAGISVKEFIAMQTAVEKLALPQEKFNQGMKRLALDIKEATRGVGRLFEITKETNGIINFKGIKGEVLSVKDVLLQIFDYINLLSDTSEKLRILENIFDSDSASQWLNIISLGRKEFEKLVDKEREYADNVEKSLPAQQKLVMQASLLGKEWDKLINTLYQYAVPVLLDIIRNINHLIDIIKSASLADVMSEWFTRPLDILANFYDQVRGLFPGHESKNQLQKRIANEDVEFWRNVRTAETKRIQNQNSNSVVNNNKFEFNVPPGAEEQQAHFITESIKRTMDDFWDFKTREVINNNPQVE